MTATAQETATEVLEGPVLEQPWAGPIAYEGVITGDERMVSPGGWQWDDLPWTLRRAPADFGGHDGAVAVGRVDRIERRADGVIWAEGVLDLGSEAGVEAARLVRQKISNGISIDPDEVSFEIRVRKELLEETPVQEDPEGAGLGLGPVDADGRVTVARYNSGDELTVYTSIGIRGVTLVDIAAFSKARIELVGDPVPTAVPEQSLAASAAPSCPPKEWFDDPQLTRLSGLTVTDDGRVFGHMADWNRPHIGITGREIMPPHSPSSYAYFHTGAVHVMTSAGPVKIATGRLTVGTGHAPDGPAGPAMAHYDNTGAAVADVRAGEDQFGIWVAGAVRPWATDEQLHVLQASPLSGDWRTIGGRLEMVASLAVNTAGFPIPRPSGVIASGQLVTLKAAGVVTAPPVGLDDTERLFVQRLMRTERAQELAARRARVAARARVGKMARTLRTKKAVI